MLIMEGLKIESLYKIYRHFCVKALMRNTLTRVPAADKRSEPLAVEKYTQFTIYIYLLF